VSNYFFADKAKMEGFCSALDAYVPGAALEAVKLFDGWLPDTRINTYIASISEHDSKEDLHGRLSMWRAFGGNTARVAIVFGVPWLAEGAEHLNIIFSPVAYLTENEVHTVIYEVIDNINKNEYFIRSVDRPIIVGTVFSMLLAAVTCLKHEGFREEREWRAIYSPKRGPSPFMEASTKVICLLAV
jgi:hypothetical protein